MFVELGMASQRCRLVFRPWREYLNGHTKKCHVLAFCSSKRCICFDGRCGLYRGCIKDRAGLECGNGGLGPAFAFPVRALTPAPVVFMVEVQQKRRCVAHPEARPRSKPEVLSSHLQMRCPTDLCHDRGPMGPGFWGLEQAISPSVRKTLRGRAQAVNMRIGAGSAHSNQLTPRKIQKTNKNTKKNKCKKQKKQKKLNKKANIKKKQKEQEGHP